MGKPTDPEKGTALPDLSDVYGGIEETRHTGGISDEPSEAIAETSASSNPKASSSGGSWFTKKRIIIIAVVAVLVVAGAVGGAVGGVLGGKSSGSNSSSGSGSDGQASGPGSSETSAATSPSSGSSGTPTVTAPATVVNSNPSATGTIIPTGFTAVAFTDAAVPSSVGTTIQASGGFPGLSAPLSSENLVQNADFKQNLTDWENTDGCWDIGNWDPDYVTAWNGESNGSKGCELAQSVTKDNASRDLQADYVFSFLYRNAAAANDQSHFWAYVGSDAQIYNVLSTEEGKPTTDDNWNKMAIKFTVDAKDRPRIVFRSIHSNDAYWEVAMVQCINFKNL